MPLTYKNNPARYLEKARERYLSFTRPVQPAEGDDPDPPEGPCWDWTGGVSGGSFPYFSLFGRAMTAHRAGWLLFRAKHVDPEHPDNKDRTVYRKCTFKRCVNPDHLTTDVLWSKRTRARHVRMLRKWSNRLGGKKLSANEMSGDARMRLAQTYRVHPDFLHLQAAFCTTPEVVLQVLTEELELDPRRPRLDRFEELFPKQTYEDLHGF